MDTNTNAGLQVTLATKSDAEDIWSLYLKTNFLYKEKLALMADGGEAAFSTLRDLLALDSAAYRIAIARDSAGTLQSACTCADFSSSERWLMHLASDKNIDALRLTTMETLEFALGRRTSWYVYTFRDQNVPIQRWLTAPFGEEGRPSVAFSHLVEDVTYDYYVVDSLALRSAYGMPDPRYSIRHASLRDVEYVAELRGDQSSKAALMSLKDDLSGGIDDLARVLSRLGHIRERSLLAACSNGAIRAIAALDLSPPWWNLSNLGTCLRLWDLSDQGDLGVQKDLATSVILYANDWFIRHDVGTWVLLVASEQTEFAHSAGSMGLSSSRRYHRLAIPNELAPSIVTQYLDYIRAPSSTSSRES